MRVLDLHASYLVNWVDEDPHVIADDMTQRIGGRVRFDTLVGTGLSGALVVPNVARVLDKHWLIVRKEGDGTHSTHRDAEGELGKRWLFVDDLISTGTTYRRVKSVVGEIASTTRHRCSHAGAYLYLDRRFQGKGD